MTPTVAAYVLRYGKDLHKPGVTLTAPTDTSALLRLVLGLDSPSIPALLFWAGEAVRSSVLFPPLRLCRLDPDVASWALNHRSQHHRLAAMITRLITTLPIKQAKGGLVTALFLLTYSVFLLLSHSLYSFEFETLLNVK